MKCQLVSTRARGTDSVAPNDASDEPKLGSLRMRMKGRPKSCEPLMPVFKPIELGSKSRSSGKKPSSKRLYPKRASLTFRGERIFRYESDTRCIVVGVTVLE